MKGPYLTSFQCGEMTDICCSAMLYQIGYTQEAPLPEPGEMSEQGIQFIKRCLAIDPMDRPTAGELLQDPWIMDFRQKYT